MPNNAFEVNKRWLPLFIFIIVNLMIDSFKIEALPMVQTMNLQLEEGQPIYHLQMHGCYEYSRADYQFEQIQDNPELNQRLIAVFYPRK
jgi:hypothetical protein